MSLPDQSRLTVLQAARFFVVSRNTIYKYSRDGKLTIDAAGTVDKADLFRLFTPRKEQAQGRKEAVPTGQELAQAEGEISRLNAEIAHLHEQLALVQSQNTLLAEQLKTQTAQSQTLAAMLAQAQTTTAGLAEKLMALPVGSRRAGSAATQQRNEGGKFMKVTPEELQGSLLPDVDRAEGRT